MAHKTTTADEAYFKARVKHWVGKLGLGDWRVAAFVDDTGENMATCEMWHDAHGAHIKLRRSFEFKPERVWLDRLALHEVLHILLCDYKCLINDRVVTESMISKSEHAIIRRLENLLAP